MSIMSWERYVFVSTRKARELMTFQVKGFIYFCFQAEDGIRDLVRSRGLGDVYKRQAQFC